VSGQESLSSNISSRKTTSSRPLSPVHSRRSRAAIVEASVRLSYELLTTLGQELWRRLAVFPSNFEAEGAAYMMGLGLAVELAREVLSEFVRFSLLDMGRRAR
jgi:hypothetical protein